MANTNPTPVGVLRAVQLCILLIFSPSRFQAAEDADNKKLSSAATVGPSPRALTVRRALFRSGRLVLFAGAIGFMAGLAFGNHIHCAAPKHITSLQIAGTCLLLWGTLFVRGWDIQSFGGVTLSERVNQWLYRFVYCLGTAALVASLSWTQCA
ncbi:hypothetical protein EAH83_11035 [Variovorax ginsengisoli]|uniref:Uncharacterized protein n=1 Tax=Variovorax guangxiensis TaxID=1775474 RepID=A0A502DX02_9BURK|nr:hypothetical protein EAH83_11035 [Variovorax ginsengisoli]TPG29209.1 hypothetical protein EAH82_10695 [Variovorax guangxiensis]